MSHAVKCPNCYKAVLLDKYNGLGEVVHDLWKISKAPEIAQLVRVGIWRHESDFNAYPPI